MRVLLITARYLPHRGGLESVVYHLAQELQRQGHTLRIVTNRYPRTLPAHEMIDGVSVTRLHFLRPEWDFLRRSRFDLFFAGLFFYFWTERRLAYILREFQPDVVNSHYLNEQAEFVGRSLNRIRKRIPWVVSLHGGDVDGESFMDNAHMQRFIGVVRQAKRLTACSQFLANQAIHLEPSMAGKLQVIHNGVDADFFAHARPSDIAAPYILAVGHLALHKGFDLLVDAFAEVSAKYPIVNLVIAGEGTLRPDLERQIKQKGLERRVILTGRVDSAKVAALMSGSLFVAMPSRRESFGIVALEGMAAGKCVLTTPVGGIPEFLPCPPNQLIKLDVVAWTLALDDWLSKAALGQLDGITNRAVTQDRTWKMVAGQYMQVYQQALAEG